MCADDEEVTAKVRKEAGKAGVDLVWGQLRALSMLQFQRAEIEKKALGLSSHSSPSQPFPTSFGKTSPASTSPATEERKEGISTSNAKVVFPFAVCLLCFG